MSTITSVNNDYHTFCYSIKTKALNAASFGDASKARSIAKTILCFNSSIPCWSDDCREAVLKEQNDLFLRAITVKLLESQNVNFTDIDETLNEIESDLVKNSALALVACKLNHINLEQAKIYGDKIKNNDYKGAYNLSRLVETRRKQLPEEGNIDFPPKFTNSPDYTQEVLQLIKNQKFDEANDKIKNYLFDRFGSDEIL